MLHSLINREFWSNSCFWHIGEALGWLSGMLSIYWQIDRQQSEKQLLKNSDKIWGGKQWGGAKLHNFSVEMNISLNDDKLYYHYRVANSHSSGVRHAFPLSFTLPKPFSRQNTFSCGWFLWDWLRIWNTYSAWNITRFMLKLELDKCGQPK